MSSDSVTAEPQKPPRTPTRHEPPPDEPSRPGVSPAEVCPPVDLVPVPGCDLCAWWDARRGNARRGIGSVSPLDCARQIAAHPHRRAGVAG